MLKREKRGPPPKKMGRKGGPCYSGRIEGAEYGQNPQRMNKKVTFNIRSQPKNYEDGLI